MNSHFYVVNLSLSYSHFLLCKVTIELSFRTCSAVTVYSRVMQSLVYSHFLTSKVAIKLTFQTYAAVTVYNRFI